MVALADHSSEARQSHRPLSNGAQGGVSEGRATAKQDSDTSSRNGAPHCDSYACSRAPSGLRRERQPATADVVFVPSAYRMVCRCLGLGQGQCARHGVLLFSFRTACKCLVRAWERCIPNRSIQPKCLVCRRDIFDHRFCAALYRLAPDCLQTLVWIPKVGTRRKNLLQVLKPCGVCRWHQRFHRQSPCLAPSAQAVPRRPRQVVTEAPRPHTLRARRPCRDCSLCHAWSPEFRRFPQFRKALPPGLRPPPLVASVSRESLDLCPCSSGTWPTARQPRRTPRLPESPPTLLGSAILSQNRLRFCD